jgi:hypothetical protein
MLALHALGWISIAAGAVAAFYGATEGAPLFLALGIASAISGVLYLALAKGLDLLADIRDRLTPPARQQPPEMRITEPAGSLADLEQRLAELRKPAQPR